MFRVLHPFHFGNGLETVPVPRMRALRQLLSMLLETVTQLQGVSFRWKDPQKDAEFGRIRGLIAQDVEKVLPEWVKTDPDGYKRIEPIGVDALLVEAIKEQAQQIKELREMVKLLVEQRQDREKKSLGELPEK